MAPSLVPRLEAAELERRDAHEFVKVSFALESLMADTVVEELKPMLSPNGKLLALAETNRIEAMDAVINLREIYSVLKDEQSADNQKRSMREFKLQYARASEVRDQLQSLLGGESKSPAMPPPQNPEQAQMQARMQQGGPPGQPGAAAKPRTAVTLVVNEHRNSILAHAPPDKMVLIVQAIEAIDVATDRGQSQVDNMSQMQVYRLVGIDPEPVVRTLEQMGNLDPTTRLEVDKKSKAIIAYASLADHATISAIVQKLSGSERKFAVRRLRRLSADYVAGSIAFMMSVEPKKKKERQNPWGWGGSQPAAEPAERPNEFRVDADIEHNRLLLLANDIELEQVDNLLVKLGEIPAKEGGVKNERVIDAGSPQEAEELLERIRREWPSVSPNPLQLPPAAPKSKKPDAAPPRATPSDDSGSQPTRTTARQSSETIFRLAELRTDVAEDVAADSPTEDAGVSASPANPPAALPPVNVRIGDDGRVIISSDDTQALDRMEELVAGLVSPRKQYKFFRLKYANAYGVALDLEDFFKNEKKPKTRSPWWWGDSDSSDSDTDDERRLSSRRKLKFISDTDKSTILVQGADQAQLKTIEELIKVFDQPPPKDADTARRTEVIRLQYAKAKDVVEAVKSVYRDLLSANDKALANGQGQKENQRTVIYDWGGTSTTDKTEQKAPKFKGLLSIGIDDTSNTLVVSAPVFLFDPVCRMIKELDKAAADSTVRVVKVGPGISAARLQEVLDSVLNPGSSRGTSATKHPAHPTGEPPKQKPGSSDSKSSDGD